MDKFFGYYILATQLPLPGFESFVVYSKIEDIVTEEKTETLGNQILLPFYSVELRLPFY